MIRNINSQRGISLVEILVVTGILVVIAGSLQSGFLSGNLSWETFRNKLNVQEEARKAMTAMTKELRDASAPVITGDGINNQRVDFSRTVGGNPENISFIWDTAGDDANRIVRQDPQGVRIIANNISQLTMTDQGGNTILVDITATETSVMGQASALRLRQKVAQR